MSDSCAQLWGQFLCSGSDAAEAARNATYSCWQFGKGAEQGDRLLTHVLSGTKRATTGALWVYETQGETVPHPGDFSVVTDGSGRARVIIRTTLVSVVPFDQVDEEYAFVEGEGDRSLAYWREGHWDYFQAELAALGRVAVLDMPVICERFEVVFPP
jgi:uncharacterized protein YhfF